ncbi:MAG: hypothetical protein LBQ81_07310 [Zoogloeaceae bacterium]|jgi:hypothetical protein|nr:hypothetical protein [Zoogloeaceae bacterium]
MPIQSGNIKFVKSQVMQDTDDGGGRATGNVIADGASNEIFPDISEMDRAGGRVRVRKAFLTVATDDTDLLLGTNVCIARPPTNPGVSVSLFTDNNYFSRRTESVNRIEAYLYKAAMLNCRLLNQHLAGMTTLTLASQQQEDLPAPGQTLYIVDHENQPDEVNQYIRTIAVAASGVVDFIIMTPGGEEKSRYPLHYNTYTLSDALRADYAGGEAVTNDSNTALGTARVRDVVVADSARYYGASPLAADVAAGELTLQIASIWNRIVPASITEVPLPDRALAGSTATPVAISTSNLTHDFQRSGLVYNLPTACMPGLTTSTMWNGVTDDGLGVLWANGAPVAAVDYTTGAIAFNQQPQDTDFSISYRPAATPAVLLDSTQRLVTEDNRSATWVVPLPTIPAAGTTTVEFMALGKWYTLKDDGSGTLKGNDAAFGSGSVNMTTGTVTVTLGALPDVYSSVMFFWSTPQLVLQQIDPASNTYEPPRIEIALDTPIKPGTLGITWQGGSAVDNGNNSLTGDAGGAVDYASGIVYFRPNTLAAPGTDYHLAWQAPQSVSSWTGIADSSNGISGTLANAPVKPGSLSCTFLVAQTLTDQKANGDELAEKFLRVTAHDDGNGSWVAAGYADGITGGIDYATGEFSLSFARASIATVYEYATATEKFWEKSPLTTYDDYYQMERTIKIQVGAHQASTLLRMDTGATAIKYISMEAFTNGQDSHSLDIGSNATLSLPLVKMQIGVTIVPGSILFTLNGTVYFDKGGIIFRDPDPATGIGTPSGSIDYASGIISLTYWQPGVYAFSLKGGLMNPNLSGRAFFCGRTALAPIKGESLFIVGNLADGTVINVAADAFGNFTADRVQGNINTETGLFNLVFAPNESDLAGLTEDEADAAYKQAMLLPASASYSAVGYSYLPMNAAQLGLDPTRLPTDGRVPVFRVGDFIVLGKSIEQAAATYSNGNTVDLGATNISRARILGADGYAIHEGWNVNLASGVVTITDVSTWAQPVTISARIENMRRVSDVQINGRISLTAPLTADFTAGDIVSSALVIGDIFGRYTNMFDQQSWNNTWLDVQQGNAATATYDDASYPVSVTNEGAITERWCIRFDSTTSISVIGEHAGIVWQGGFTNDIAPINPAVGVPYFTLPAGGFGTGWATGNIIRFNTIGAATPIWIIETVQQGTEAEGNDAWELLARGDVDA